MGWKLDWSLVPGVGTRPIHTNGTYTITKVRCGVGNGNAYCVCKGPPQWSPQWDSCWLANAIRRGEVPLSFAKLGQAKEYCDRN